ncbi:MAG: T9SS type A sorting domain-containing protein, partial [Chitinophagaceae bacterium]|nr:T9SS type A sorting domain-containing protein [Chitinophagaceae bacterium]
MTKLPVALLLFCSFFLCSPVFAQQQQLAFSNRESPIIIYDQYIEPNGDVVSVASILQDPPFPSPHLLVFKADPAGTVIWSYYTGYTNHRAVRIRKAANGDYLVLSQSGSMQLLRLKPDGTQRWAHLAGFSTAANYTVGGVTELPNGNIAVCGYNDFDYDGWAQFQGHIIIQDSAGAFVHCRDYGHTKSWIDDQYYFLDIICLGNKLYAVGIFEDKYYYTQALLMVMDLNGNMLDTRVLPDRFISGTDTLLDHSFLDLSVVNGQLWIHGKANAPRQSQIVGHVDTTTMNFSGYTVSSKSYKGFFNPRCFIKDTNEFYSVATPTPAYSDKKVFISKIKNGVPEYCKKVQQDSLLIVHCISNRGDTVYTAGQINTSKKDGYAAYLALNDTATGCGITDTTLSVHTFSVALQTPLYAPLSQTQWPTSYYIPSWEEVCIQAQYLCGDKVCPPSLHADIDVLSPGPICPGDTVQLFAGGCFPKTWYRDGIPLPEDSNLLKVTIAGKYQLVVSNNACADTSRSITVRYNPRPVIYRVGDSLYSSTAVAYVWLDSTRKPIRGAEKPYFIPKKTGTYYVTAMDSSGCIQTSDSFFFSAPSGIHKIGEAPDQHFQVFPNPIADRMSVSNHTGQAALMVIRNLNGQVVYSASLSPGEHVYSSDILQLRPGFYWIQFIQSESCTSKKIIV